MIYFLKRWLKIINELFYIVKSAEKECGFITILPFTVFQLDLACNIGLFFKELENELSAVVMERDGLQQSLKVLQEEYQSVVKQSMVCTTIIVI